MDRDAVRRGSRAYRIRTLSPVALSWQEVPDELRHACLLEQERIVAICGIDHDVPRVRAVRVERAHDLFRITRTVQPVGRERQQQATGANLREGALERASAI